LIQTTTLASRVLYYAAPRYQLNVTLLTSARNVSQHHYWLYSRGHAARCRDTWHSLESYLYVVRMREIKKKVHAVIDKAAGSA